MDLGRWPFSLSDSGCVNDLVIHTHTVLSDERVFIENDLRSGRSVHFMFVLNQNSCEVLDGPVHLHLVV